ncbi:HTTM domain-containing protein [Bdellovibrio sp. ArHS]|uniref:HTTM domain-containing protein n=1 Tax=Bdellovibrio sp. ArHS TaxID=1569284 RepID=UPI000A508BC0|nr:HTTM domain-containing protein [Bdellovibrio sp. ArHS]
MKLTTIAKSLNEFFFKPQPVHSVALLRIAFGVILLINWFMMWSHLDIFWGVDGILSMETALKFSHGYRFNLFELFPNQQGVAVFLALLNLLGVLGMLFGCFTRTSMALAFFTLLSFHNRNIFVLNSSDVVVRNFLFLLFFTPAGALYSVDRWWQIKRKKIAKEDIPEHAPWALRLMQIQFSLIYIATVMFKMKGSLWADGTAVYIATRLDEFMRVPLPILNNLVVIKFLTWSTLAIELALGTLVWIREFRYWVLLAGIALHLGIEISMSIPLFEWVMIAGMICMVDSRDIQAVLESFKKGTLLAKFHLPRGFIKTAKANIRG